MQYISTWALSSSWEIINDLSSQLINTSSLLSNLINDSSLISIIISILCIFVSFILWITTYLVWTQIPIIKDTLDIEDEVIKQKVSKDLDTLLKLKQNIQKKLKFIFVSVVLIPIIVVILYYLKFNYLFLIITSISILYYFGLFFWAVCQICKIIHYNLILEWYQNEIIKKDLS